MLVYRGQPGPGYALRDICDPHALTQTLGVRLARPLLLVLVLRAGPSIVDEAYVALSKARVGFVGIVCDEGDAPADPVFRIAARQPDGQLVMDLDPMLTTGGSMTHTTDLLLLCCCVVRQQRSPFSVMLAVTEGIAAVGEVALNTWLFTAVINEGLNKAKYIMPGLDDAGDRQSGFR